MDALQADGLENSLSTECTLSVLENAVDALLCKFGDEVRGLLQHHLQQSFPEGNNEPKLLQHIDERDSTFRKGLDLPEPLPDEEVGVHEKHRLPSFPSMSGKIKKTNSVADIVNKPQVVAQQCIADECIFETARERALANQTNLQRWTRSQPYEWVSGLLILLNAAFIGIQTELQAQQSMEAAFGGTALPANDHPGIIFGSAVFTVLFTVDLGLRWVSEGLLDFFRSADCSWCVFDVIIVALSIIDSAFSILMWASGTNTDTSALSSISALRILRVARIVKLAKVIRLMSFFRELRVMIYSILGSMKSLLWLTLILGVTFYVFGITFTSGTNTYLEPAELWINPSNEGLRDNFGTIGRSLLALYMAMAGGRSWGEYYVMMNCMPWAYGGIFLAFLTFTIFAVLNIVTGVFVDSAMRANTSSRQVVVHEELDSKKDMLRDLSNLFNEMDQNGDGAISMDEFCARLNDERVVAYFKALKLDVHDTIALFHLLDTDEDEEVDMAEFLDGCYQLQGEARSIDTKVMRLQLQYIVEHMQVLQEQQRTQAVAMSKLSRASSRGQLLKDKVFLGRRIRSASDPTASNGNAQRVLGPSDGISIGSTSDDRCRNGDVLVASGMHASRKTPTTRVTALKPMQRLVCEQEMFATPGEASDSHLHSFLSQESSQEQAMPPLNGRDQKARMGK